MIEVIKAPIETKIIEEVKPPEPPPPENLPPPPKFAPPPPSFVPPPEVNVAPPPTPAPTITTTQVAPPVTPMRITPAPAVAASAPPAPRAPARTEPRIDFQNACERPEYNAAARRAEAQGSTTILFTMDTTGQISEATVEKSSGPSREHKMLDRLALEAVRNCKGTPGTVDGKPEKLTSRITYVWRITD
ncbi:MAG: energy transducer TonB [Rubrivivax sp.]|nr:energy transducer TonB [Betaproteobacteria bacterium]MBP6318090.1 energy transducer TonB [Rubrivivax sp.]MBK7277993.1 energy transducer TonB [Betaproteobacteria bacterium]MBK7457075.1 energy transducer TonB [Betaproteobacteria bacterium]MBK7518207.1 energy transducer TonB [Betaproteobacteria bacterium]